MEKIYLNSALGVNLPPFWLNRPVVPLGKTFAHGELIDNPAWVHAPDKDATAAAEAYLGNLYQAPLSMRWEGEGEDGWWKLPLDPVISVTGKNSIIRRNVCKAVGEELGFRGSVKEAWSQDDYEVNIAGVLINRGGAQRPVEELRRLRRYCEARKVVLVDNELLGIFGIARLCIESYSLPFTKGLENQQYTIKAYSDSTLDLLIEE
jgi:hypothetical protein